MGVSDAWMAVARLRPLVSCAGCGLLAVLAVLGAGCSSGDDAQDSNAQQQVCMPFTAQQCFCAGETTPRQMQCTPDGLGYTACPCPATPVGGVGGGGAGGVSGSAGMAGSSAGASGTAGAAGGAGTAGAAGGAGMADASVPDASTTPDAGYTEPGAVVFEPNIKLNDDSGNARQSEVALAAGPDGLVIAGWMDERAERVCAYSFSTDSGMTWSENVSIPNVSSFVGDPTVAIDGGGTLYAICQQYGARNIRMMTSRDQGGTWSSIENIGSAPDKPWAQGGTDPGVLFVSWLGNPGGIKRSLDYGVTWDPTQSTGNIIHGTAITAATTGLVHVPYNLDSSRNQLRYLRSKDNGVTYDEPRDLLEDMGTFCFNCNPRQHPIVGAGADPTGQVVAITWTSDMPGGEGDDDVWLLYSNDGGDTWTDPIRVNDNEQPSRQFESWVAVDAGGWVHVAWTDFRRGQNDTYYARSKDPRDGFETSIKVNEEGGTTNTDFLGDYKGITVSGADVIVVWQDTRNDSGDIYVARAPGAAATGGLQP